VDLSQIKLNQLDRYQLVQIIKSDFWSRWSHEYLNTLQQRSKWTKEKENVKIGEFVMHLDDLKSPHQWPLARIMEIFPGNDGKVRRVKIKLQDGSILIRPIHRLAQLPFNQDSSTTTNNEEDRKQQ